MASDRIRQRIDRLLDRIEQEADQDDWQRVLDLVDQVLSFDPENIDAAAFKTVADRKISSTANANRQTAAEVITPPSSPITEPPSTPAAPEAERRQLTVMFCDLQGSTALSQQLDPEDLRNVIRSYQEVCAGAVGRFEGHIAKYLGDGLLVYFGYPQAHEDDPQRAVRAGLAILQDMIPLNARLKSSNDLELTVRIGVHTGLVVAGEMGGGDTIEELAIVGETPNIASRLEGAAEPNTVAISDVTARLVQGFFICETMGFHELKGISLPMELFRVLEESGAQSRFDVASAAELTPMVGREQEVGLLMDRWDLAKEGLGQVVLLSGEPGIGKSRSIKALSDRLGEEPHTVRRLRCSAYHQNSALHPILEYLDVWLGFGRDDPAEERLGKVVNALARIDFPAAEAVSLLSGLQSVPLAEGFPILAMSPEVQRERSLQLLVALLLDSANDQPVFLVVEDLHWADPSTLTMLGLLLEQVPTSKVLVLFSFRPEFTPPWPSRAYITPMMLSRLTGRLVGDMVHRLTGGKTLPEEVLSQVAIKSDGVPIFVEELTRMLLESDLLKEVGDHYELTGPLTRLAIPSTLQDSLTARLDRLSSAREVAQLGSVLGREFTYELIKAVSPLGEELLGSHLRQLVDSEFLHQVGSPPNANYTFKHALIQDAAYESLLRSNKQRYHRQVAQALEEGFADTVETQPELLAHHFAEGGLTERAVNYWLRAGERALVVYANEEALAHFERGLIGRSIPLSGTEAASDEQAADLLCGLARAQSATGVGQQLVEAFAKLPRAFEYYAAAGNVEKAVTAAAFPIGRGGVVIPGVADLIARALALVPANSHEAGRLLSRYGGPLGREEGHYDAAQDAFSRALTIARREGDQALEMRTLAEAANLATQHLRLEETLKLSLSAIELARRIDDTRSEVTALFAAAGVSYTQGDLDGAVRHATEQLRVAEKLGDRIWLEAAHWRNEAVAHLAGDWQTAREYSDRGLASWSENAILLCTRVLLEYEVGEFDQGEAHLTRLLEATGLGTLQSNGYWFSAVVPLFVDRITGEAKWTDVAAQVAKSVVAAAPPPVGIMSARAALGLVAVARGEADSANEQYVFLQQYSGIILLGTLRSVDRILGLLSQTMGTLEQSAAHFEDAQVFCRNAGYKPELAWACCDHADVLIGRNGQGDRTKAMVLLDESVCISSELGMSPLMERAMSRLERLRA